MVFLSSTLVTHIRTRCCDYCVGQLIIRIRVLACYVPYRAAQIMKDGPFQGRRRMRVVRAAPRRNVLRLTYEHKASQERA